MRIPSLTGAVTMLVRPLGRVQFGSPGFNKSIPVQQPEPQWHGAKLPGLCFRGMYGRSDVILNDVADQSLYPNLVQLKKVQQVLETTAREKGLDPYPVVFHLVEPNRFFEVAAQKGYPNRYPHWSWGQEYYELKQPYQEGARSFKEVVINNAPVHSYLLETNPDYGQKALMAHSLARSDFYKNNKQYAASNRQTMALMNDHAQRIETLVQDPAIGAEPMEQFIDKVHSLKDLIDFETLNPGVDLSRVPTREAPQWDVLGYVMRNAPALPTWQREVIGIVREESYAMTPHLKTRVMSDGWASFWNRRLNAQNAKLLDITNLSRESAWSAKVFELNSVAVNTYMLGAVIYEALAKKAEEAAAAAGLPQADYSSLFAIRTNEEDTSFIQKHLTQEMVEDLLLYLYKPEKGREAPGTRLKISSKDFAAIKANLLELFKNGGLPTIGVVEGNYNNKGELLLQHVHEFDLKQDYAQKTLNYLESLWGKPVHLFTKKTDKAGNAKQVMLSSVSGRIVEADIGGGI